MNDSKNTPTNDESSLPTTPNAQSRAAYFEDMLPGVIASDERDGRLGQALKRRRNGVPLTTEEVRRDLKAVLSQLTVSFMQYEHSFSTFLRTPTHALDYAERVAAYAMKDYPRELENDVDIAGLWDTLKNIHIMGYAWRKGEDKTDGKQLVITINKIATDALNRIYPTENEGEKSQREGRKSSSSDPTARMSKAEVMAELDRAAQKDAAAAQADTVLVRENVFKKPSTEVGQLDHTADQNTQAEQAADVLVPTQTDVADSPDTPTNQGTALVADATTTAEVSQIDSGSEPTDLGATAREQAAKKDETVEAEKTDETVEAEKTAAKTDKVAKVDSADKADEDDKIDLSW